MAKRYSAEFKESIIQKLLLPGSPGISEIARKSGVSHVTIRRWQGFYGNEPVMANSNKWTPEQKLKSISETLSLSENELGEYLRKNGLHSAEIDEWREAFLNGFKTPGRPKKDPELKASIKRENSLKRDLNRKDKALAEMSARIVLLKKSHLLWGEPEEDE